MFSFFVYLWLCYWSLRFLNFLKHIIRCYWLPAFGFTVNIRKYGEWAVVTGATDGIGKCYAFELAKRKFNIVLISRTKLKLDNVAKEIEGEFGVKTKCIVFDFSTPVDYTLLEENLKELDIGVLVNNVGMSGDFKKLFDDIEMKEHLNVLHTNIFGALHLSHFIMKGMIREKCGAIIHVSSSFGFFPMGLIGLYAPTKAFINAFVTNLQKESKACESIHHQLVTPFFVHTNMTKDSMQKGFLIPDAESFVSSAVDTIGLAPHICGCISHELLGAILSIMPGFIFNLVPLVKGFQSRCDYKRKKMMNEKDL